MPEYAAGFRAPAPPDRLHSSVATRTVAGPDIDPKVLVPAASASLRCASCLQYPSPLLLSDRYSNSLLANFSPMYAHVLESAFMASSMASPMAHTFRAVEQTSS